jgi:DNA uptake protein ComE-like DNA-binding protein
MNKTRRGYILVQALIVIAGLLALMAMLAADQRVGSQAVQDRLRQRRADTAADSAVAQALATVETANPNVVTLNDDWAKLGDSGNEEFSLGDAATFRVQIVDAGALVSVNTAASAQLERLPLTKEQVDCLLDWREPKTQARPDGAKDAYYLSLPTPYNAKLGPLDTLDELLLVKGWTGQTLYQTPTAASQITLPTDPEGNVLPLASLLTAESGAPSVQADGLPRVNLGQPGADQAALTQAGVSAPLAMQLASGTTYDSFATLLALPEVQPSDAGPLLNAVTFTSETRSEGKIDLNTASEAVLRSLPAVTPGIASAIVNRQEAGFHSLGELASLPGVDGPRLAQIADSFTVGSDTWIVRAYGSGGNAHTAVEAVIGRRSGNTQILSWTRLNTMGIPAWWGWNTQSNETTDAGDER